MKKRYVVTLTDEERRSLPGLVSFGKGAARKPVQARILLWQSRILRSTHFALNCWL